MSTQGYCTPSTQVVGLRAQAGYVVEPAGGGPQRGDQLDRDGSSSAKIGSDCPGIRTTSTDDATPADEWPGLVTLRIQFDSDRLMA
jgi:hypothetical protein